jgi:hypothetical protein
MMAKPYSKKSFTITLEFWSERQDECWSDVMPMIMSVLSTQIETKHKGNKITIEENLQLEYKVL